MRRSSRRGLIFALAVVSMLTAATSALAVVEPIDNVDLNSFGGTAVWNAENHAENGSCPFSNGETYSPVDDGSFQGTVLQDDAFDSGLMLYVTNTHGFLPFQDADDNGNHVGDSLTVGPQTIGGVRITQTDRGLPNSPTLRLLVKITNTTASAKTRTALLCSEVGSDSDTGIRASSTGDHQFTNADRWLVTSDDPTTPTDPPVTHVFNGKGSLRTTRAVYCAPATVESAEDCIATQFRFTVPGNRTRYLLFYAEMHDTNAHAINGAAKFNNKHLTPALLNGISSTVRGRILNWDLG